MHHCVFRRTAVIFLLLLSVAKGACAQAPDTSVIISQQTADSIIATLAPGEYDSLMAELDNMLGFLNGHAGSYVDISLTGGNGNFTLKGSDAASVTYKVNNRFVLTPAIGYFHKSGVGVQWASNLASSKGSLTAYQHQASVFYDYTEGKKASAGISYTRMIVNDSVDFYTSPYQHNINIYGTWKKTRLRPSLSLNFSNGAYTETFVRPFLTLHYKVKISEFSATASLRYTFTKKNLLARNDYFMFTPRIMLTGAGQNLRMVNSDNVRLNRLISNGTIAQRSVSSFEPQTLALSLAADYMVGKWYIHPQFYADYYLHNADKRSYSSFSVTTGVNL